MLLMSSAIVGGPRAVGGSDLDEVCTGLGHHLRHAEAAARLLRVVDASLAREAELEDRELRRQAAQSSSSGGPSEAGRLAGSLARGDAGARRDERHPGFSRPNPENDRGESGDAARRTRAA